MTQTKNGHRVIDDSIAKADKSLRKQFALVAKSRANIWLTITAVIFVLGVAIGTFSVLGGGLGLSSEASFSWIQNLRRSVTNTTQTQNKAAGLSTTSINNQEGNPTAGTITTCSYWNQAGCQITITGPTTVVQGRAGSFKIYGTQQVDRPCPGDPTCPRAIIWFPNIVVDWGDGTLQSSSIRTGYDHNYLTPGTYTVTAMATYNKQQYFPRDEALLLTNPDNRPTTFVVGPKTFTVTVTPAASAVISATRSPESPPAGPVTNNATAVEFALIDLKNNSTTSPKTINAMLVGCRDGYAPQHTNGTAAPQPFASNKTFTVKRVGGGIIAKPTTFSSAREFGTIFSNTNFQMDSLLRFKCKAAAYKTGGTGSGSGGVPLIIPAGATATVSLIADVGQMDPCTRLQLGVMAAYSTAQAGPLLSSAGMGNVMVVPGTNPYTGETCGGGSAGGGGGGGSGNSALKSSAKAGTTTTKGTTTQTPTKK